jgi:fibronectin-binding autotransporter adhesin
MSKSEGRVKCSFLAAATLTLATFAAASGQAATDTWSGGGANANWMTPGNWDTLPVALDVLQFAGSTKLTNTNDFAASTQFNGINFNAGAGSFVLAGSAVVLGGDINDNALTNAQTISLPLQLDGATSNVNIVAGGALTLGSVTFGKTAGSTNLSTLNINNSTSFASLIAQTSSATANTLAIAAGQTLNVNGAVTVGGFDPVNTAQSSRLDISGNSLVVNAGANSLLVGANSTGTAGLTATLNMANLANFSFTGAEFNIGGRQANTTGNRSNGNVTLAGTSNAITVTTLNVGAGSNSNAGGNNNLNLGGGTNIINANSIIVGSFKSTGTMQFTAGTPAGTGSLTIRNTAGTGRAAITIGSHQSSGTVASKGSLLFNTHSVDILASTMIVGQITSATTTQTVANQVSFDTGTIDATSIILGQKTGTAVGIVSSTFTMGGGTLIVNSPSGPGTGVFTLGNNGSSGTGSANGILNLNGGLAQINSNILLGTATGTATINLQGATLDMLGHNIGSAALPINTVNLASGNLKNAGTITGQSITIGSGVTIGGAPSYVIGNGGSLSSALTTLTLASGGTLSGGGAAGATVTGDVTAANGARISPGSSTVASTLQFGNNLSFDSGSTARLKLSENAASGNDAIVVGSNLTLTGTVNLEIGSVGAGPHFGNTYTLFTYGTLSGNETNLNLIAPVGTRSTYTLLPTSTTPNSIQLQVAGTAPFTLTWIGNANNNWDLIGAANWKDLSHGPASQQFFNQDAVTFDDTSTNLNDVQLVGQLLPNTVTVNATRNYKFAGAGSITGGTVTKSGSGTLILANNNTYSGNTDIQSGTLQIGDGGTTGSIGSGTISNAATLSYKRSDATTASNAISGAGVVRQDGAGTLTLSGNSTFSGGLVVNSGAVRLASVTGAGTGGITVNPGTTLVYGAVALNALTLAGGTVGTSVTLNPIAADVTAAPATNSTIYLADPQNLPTTPGTDATEVNITGTLHGSGTITILSNGQDAGPDAGNGFRLRGTGTSDFTGKIILGNTVKGELQSTIVGPTVFSPAGSGTIALTAGTIAPGALTGTFSELNLRNSTGPSGGNVTFGNNVEIVGSGVAVINPLTDAATTTAPAGSVATMGYLKIGAGQTLAVGKNSTPSLSAAFQSVTLTGGNATFAPTPPNTGFSGTANLTLGSISELTAGSGIVMAGKSTLFINGASTYTGPTTVSSGTLQLAAPDVLPNASKLVLSGGKFSTAGNNETVNTLVVTAPSAIDLGAGASVLHFADSHLESWQGPVTITNWSGNLTTGAGTDQVFFGSSNTGLSGSQVNSVHFNGFNGATLLGTGELIPVSVSSFHLGDWNSDGTVNSADISVMLNALTDLNAYASATSPLHSAYPFALTNDDLLNIGDVNLSGSISNGDIQAELDLVTSLGGGSLSAVPEPASFVLLACGGLALALARRRKRASRS